MKVLDAKCKFCGCPLKLKIDDDYAALGDPLKLLPLAACNRCADFHAEMRRIKEGLRECILRLLSTKTKDLPAAKSETRPRLEKLTQRYVRAASCYSRTTVNAWAPQMVDDILDSPRSLPLVLKAVWRSDPAQIEMPITPPGERRFADA
jgi:hypothetical protein